MFTGGSAEPWGPVASFLWAGWSLLSVYVRLDAHVVAQKASTSHGLNSF